METYTHIRNFPDSKVHGPNMSPTLGRPGGAHVGPINLVIWEGNAIFQCVNGTTIIMNNQG